MTKFQVKAKAGTSMETTIKAYGSMTNVREQVFTNGPIKTRTKAPG
jgi:hypothetical protein